MNIKHTLKVLSDAVCIGDIREASVTAKDILKEYCPVTECEDSGFYGKFDFGREKTVIIEAHIDEVGMIVTDIDDEGFVTVCNCGGIDPKILSATPVVIHSSEKHNGVFCSVPPHLSNGKEKYDDISKIKIDTGLSKKAAELISIGDFVTYGVKSQELCENCITGKSLDNRAGCTALLLLAERLKKAELPVNVVLLFSYGEELGLRGVRTAAYGIKADEAIVIDVSFAQCPDIPKEKSGIMSNGAMIGFSPVLSSAISEKLVYTAEKNGFLYQKEVMGSSTGTDADVLSLVKEGIPCGLVSIPLKNMHSPVEIVDINDILSTVDIIEKYILFGGVSN